MFEISVATSKCTGLLRRVAIDCGSTGNYISGDQTYFSFEEKSDLLDFTRTEAFLNCQPFLLA